MVEVARVEPELTVHVFASTCMYSYLTAVCEMFEMHVDEDKLV